MQPDRKTVRRAGTSFIEFEKKFPDQESCLAHIMSIRLDEAEVCTACGRPRKFRKISKRYSYISKCCTIIIRSPMAGTIFAHTQMPLLTWFRAILYFTNASMGISPSFISHQFGIARAASMRTCQLIRRHLDSIDHDIRLGSAGSCVYVSQTTMKAVSRLGKKNGVRFRILLATDGAEFLAIPIATGEFGRSRDLLLNRLVPSASIITQDERLRKRILNHYASSKAKGHNINAADNPYDIEFNNLSVYGIALKGFILRSHNWIRETNINSYIGHFSFLYRRRHRGEAAFWDAISYFPSFLHEQ
jgi:transposase